MGRHSLPEMHLAIRDQTGELVLAERPVTNPVTAADFNRNVAAAVFNRAQLGGISWIDAHQKNEGAASTLKELLEELQMAQAPHITE